jgi:hypothetical protein
LDILLLSIYYYYKAKKFSCRLLSPAVRAVSFDHEPPADNPAPFPDFVRKGYPVTLRAVIINNFSASQAVKVMVFMQVRVVTPGLTPAFHHPENSNFGKTDERSVDRIKGNMG